MATDHRSKKRKRDVELPDEMLFEILSWLPTKSVCISKCCSKSFLNLTNSTNFAIKHSQNSLLKDDSYFFIQDCFSTRKTGIHSSLPSYSSTSDQIPRREKVGVPSKFLHHVVENSVRIIASSNGLLLCQTPLLSMVQWQLSICNPATQSQSFIPSPFPHDSDHFPDGVMFSFECNNNNDEEYKLYALHEDDLQSQRSLVCKMYRPKEVVWKETETRFILGKKYLMSFNQLPLFYKGAIHFQVYENSSPRYCKYVASYNVESGVSTMIKLPDKTNDGEMGIFKWDEIGSKKESLCLVSLKGKLDGQDVFTVWVLSDHESSSGGNWSNILNSVSLKELGLDRKWSRVVGFTVMNGHSLVFATEKEVYDYDLSGKRETRLKKVCNHKLKLRPFPSVILFPYTDILRATTVRLLPYSDTLRSCGIDSTTLGE